MTYSVYLVDDATPPDPRRAIWDGVLPTLPVEGAVFTLASGTFEVTGHVVVPGAGGQADDAVCLRVRLLRRAKARPRAPRRERWHEPTLAMAPS